jgi:mono/diheme cytochrome c family protein
MSAQRIRPLWLVIACLAICLAWVALATRAEPPAAAKIDFTRDIHPIFANHCFKCHGPDEEEGGLRLDIRQRALTGGSSGPSLVPGKRAESLIYQFVTGRNDDKIIMPPKGKGQRLSPTQCEIVGRWIDDGAPWPE